MARIESRIGCCLAVVFAACEVHAATIETVPIGSPANAADTRYLDANHPSGIGSVSWTFRVGATEVTNTQYTEFLNSVAALDPYGLYSTAMGSTSWGGIDRSGSPGSYSYSVKSDAPGQGFGGADYSYADKPVVFVSWFDSVRFANWMHNGQGSVDTENGAYTLLGGTPTPSNASTVTRNPGARWWLPSEDEWYKAAYYDASAGVYHDYPSGDNGVLDNNFPMTDSGNSANFFDGVNPIPSFPNAGYTTGNGNYPLTDAGSYSLSASPFGTFDQGGSVLEWNDTLFGTLRSLRGGSWIGGADSLRASSWFLYDDTLSGGANVGFRVATVPEPSLLLLALTGLCVPLVRRREIDRTIRPKNASALAR